jgi:4-amino-4-deoxy-L-arabinose transferase-like glycosyltransferase
MGRHEPTLTRLSAVFDDPKIQWATLIMAALLLLFAQANESRIYGDSVRYAAIARSMADSGKYATLEFGQGPNHHGPLLFWLAAFAIKLFGPTPFAASLFSRLFALGCVLLTGWLGSRLFGRDTGWLAALALMTTFTFVRNAGVLRMDSGLTFGVLSALAGYFNGDRRWGPPLFFGGVVVAVLSKSVPGFLPLVLAPLHALLAGRFYWPWDKRSLRWLAWSPLLLLALAWWGYLLMQYGTEPFSVLLWNTVLTQKSTGETRISQFFSTYILQFGKKYWPWLPFALFGSGVLVRRALDTKRDVGERAASGLMLGWVAVVLITVGQSGAQYERYILPALPAISIMTAVAVMRILKGKIPGWIPGVMAGCTIIAAIALACLPLSVQGGNNGEGERVAAATEIINQRLPRSAPIPLLILDGDIQRKRNFGLGDDPGSVFFFGREARATIVAEIKQAAARGRVTFLVLAKNHAEARQILNPEFLIRSSRFVLAEIGSGDDISFSKTPRSIQNPPEEEAE